MATGGAPYLDKVVQDLWLELWYIVNWINLGQVQHADLYWALEILRILDDSTGFPRGQYDLCHRTIIATAHRFNIVPQFKVYFYFLWLIDFNPLISINCMLNN